jgi:hypothetical protein
MRPLPMLVWIGFDRPLEMWCFKCGRALPRPFDRRFAREWQLAEVAS